MVDNQMTPSARFADYVLPDTMNQEIDDMQGDAYAQACEAVEAFLKK